MLRDPLVHGGPVVLRGNEHTVPTPVRVAAWRRRGDSILERVRGVERVYRVRSRSDVDTGRAAGPGAAQRQRRHLIGGGGLDGLRRAEGLGEGGEVFWREEFTVAVGQAGVVKSLGREAVVVVATIAQEGYAVSKRFTCHSRWVFVEFRIT